MSKEIHKLILEDISDRTEWANRQAIWYQMRHDGLRRRRKPFPGAADMHFPLIDQSIEKLAPFYYNQIFAMERLAAFVGRPDAPKEIVSAAEAWFDYKVKEKSNFEDDVPIFINSMLQSGRGPLKIGWDVKNKCLKVEAIEAIYLIVPKSTGDLHEGDRVTHVQHISKWAYKNGPMSSEYNQDESLIKRICGKGDGGNEEDASLVSERSIREGITHSDDKNTIVLWEVFERTASGWKVHTFSPTAPDEPVRKEFGLPYNHGQLPIVSFQMERKARGYYDSRGISEIVASFETALCKNWNEKLDSMTYFNRPLLSSEKEIANPGNLTWQPGMILPFAVNRVDLGQPPISFDDEMRNTRAIAEQRIAMPDLGMDSREGKGGKATATEIDAITNLASTVIDMRSRLNRRQLKRAYEQMWSLLKQYDDDFAYLSEGELKQLPKEARDSIISISPAGSSSSWNKDGQLRKAMARKQLLGGAPHINQVELDKSILELDDPGLIQRLIIDPNLPAQEQASRQMIENAALMLGQPIPINEDDNDEVHAHVIMQFKFQMSQQQAPVTPQIIQAIDNHFAAHMQRLDQRDKPGAARVKQAMAQMKAAVEMQAQQQQRRAA